MCASARARELALKSNSMVARCKRRVHENRLTNWMGVHRRHSTILITLASHRTWTLMNWFQFVIRHLIFPQMKEQICYCQNVDAAIIHKMKMNNFSYFPLQRVCRSAGAILPFYLYAPRVLLVIFVFNLKIMQTITLHPTTIARWKRLRVVRAAASKHHFDFRNVRRWKSYMWVFCLRTKANSIQFRVFFPLRSSHMNAFLLLVHSVTKSKDRGSGTKEPFGQLKLIENLN